MGKLSGLWETIGTTDSDKIDPAAADERRVVGETVFVAELLGNVGVLDADVFLPLHLWYLEKKLAASKQANLAPRRKSTELIISLTRSSDAPGVPTSPGYLTLVPATVMRVRSGSALPGRTSHTTLTWEISFRRSGVMLS